MGEYRRRTTELFTIPSDSSKIREMEHSDRGIRQRNLTEEIKEKNPSKKRIRQRNQIEDSAIGIRLKIK